ncbi:hypothetical protein F7Q99_25175 [Streptomyces kaniharaensis]|uniref:Uncharacterized protein n=1 Tax=Streptomyces kaniharaensis TaxID=212423 RepID=A0A6N7KVI8_9ACTN|nr:hypothetical protein [Streptomyces kaniharaensis]MQS15471.1 hypothetical protein [Streptomyces kaniharaensis]
MVSDQQQLQRGYFLREAAALQRTNTDGARRLTRIAFPAAESPDDAPLVLVTTSGPGSSTTTLRLAATATRDDLYAALADEGGGWAAPDPEPLTRLPRTAPEPPLLVYADLLDDLGDLLFTLTGYPADVGRPDIAAGLDAVGLTGETTATVEVTALGAAHRIRIPLDSGVPLVAVPLEIAEHLLKVPRASSGEEPGPDWDYPVSPTKG